MAASNVNSLLLLAEVNACR